MAGNSSERKLVGARTIMALAGLILAAGCSMRGTPFNTTVVRDGSKVYTYKGGVVKCPDGRRIPYHPTDYEKESGFSIPSICNYGPDKPPEPAPNSGAPAPTTGDSQGAAGSGIEYGR